MVTPLLGQRVVIRGLVAMPELNGRAGTLTKLHLTKLHLSNLNLGHAK